MYLSKSRLACYMQCPRKYQLRYVEKLETPASPALLEGSAIHAIVEAAIINGNRDEESLKQYSDEYWSTVSLEKTTYPSQDSLYSAQEKTWNESSAFLRLLGDVHAYDAETELEYPLTNPITCEVREDIVIRGYADLIISDGNTTKIVDIKTSRCSPCGNLADRSIDLSTYAYLASMMFGWNCEIPVSLLYLVRTKEPKIFWLHSYRDTHDCQQFFDTVVQIANGIYNNVFHPCPSVMCSSCEYSGICFERSVQHEIASALNVKRVA